MFAEHPLTKHSVVVTLLVHACQQHVDLCIRGCSHQHASAGWGIFLKSPHLSAHTDRSHVSRIGALGEQGGLAAIARP